MSGKGSQGSLHGPLERLGLGLIILLSCLYSTMAVQVGFQQLTWLDDEGNIKRENSRVGVATFSFDLEDSQLLDAIGGGYINLLTQIVPPSSVPEIPVQPQWSVQNLRLSYRDEDEMTVAHPSVKFGLDVENETRLQQISYNVIITADPLPEFPIPEFPNELFIDPPALVEPKGYLVGGIEGGGSGELTLYETIGNWQGCPEEDCNWQNYCVEGSCSLNVQEPARVAANASNNAVNESPMGCGPASVARALKAMFPEELENISIQDLYKRLYDLMGTDPAKLGTTLDNLKTGKKNFAKSQKPKLRVRTNDYKWKSGIRQAQAALKSGGQAEIRFVFPPKAEEKDGNKDAKKKKPKGKPFGHIAQVTSITAVKDGYQIKYVDDPNQKDDKAEDKEHVVTVDKRGKITSPKDGGVVTHFVVENKTGRRMRA